MKGIFEALLYVYYYVNKHFQLLCSEQRLGVDSTDRNTIFFTVNFIFL